MMLNRIRRHISFLFTPYINTNATATARYEPKMIHCSPSGDAISRASVSAFPSSLISTVNRQSASSFFVDVSESHVVYLPRPVLLVVPYIRAGPLVMCHSRTQIRNVMAQRGFVRCKALSP